MIFLVHRNAKAISRVLSENEVVQFKSPDICFIFWEVAEKYPDEIIVWVEEEFFDSINKSSLDKIFSHSRIMASYAIKTNFFSNNIGYIDQMPFVNINRGVKYPTWMMSTDIGGVYGSTLLSFKSRFKKIDDFGYLINLIAKIGQQNGLFCYSHPDLISLRSASKLQYKANLAQEFSFVYSNYKTVWTYIYFWCLWRYENKLSILKFLKSFLAKKHFGENVDLPSLKFSDNKNIGKEHTIDVIIPTIGRPEYLKDVLEDLNSQNMPPSNVIVIEQMDKMENFSQLNELKNRQWVFTLKIVSIDKIGVCNARNIGLKEVTSEWTFFADDDIRFSDDLLANVVREAQKYNCDAINMNCKQQGEKTIFHKIKQWGSFGSGTSVVKSKYAKKCQFSLAFEGGYGEDADYGMQLRNVGCDIIYHPEIKMLHLKAPSGGFREIINKDQKLRDTKKKPKPAPTIMALALRHFTPQQRKGFKVSLFLKFYKDKMTLNPISFVNTMNKRWTISEEMAKSLLKNASEEKAPKFTKLN